MCRTRFDVSGYIPFRDLRPYSMTLNMLTFKKKNFELFLLSVKFTFDKKFTEFDGRYFGCVNVKNDSVVNCQFGRIYIRNGKKL